MRFINKLFIIFFICGLMMIFSQSIFSQDESIPGIKTALEFFLEISEDFGSINDYEADITIKTDMDIYIGRISYKKPNLIRIDFSEPEGLIFSISDNTLIIYIPKYKVTFEQDLPRRSRASIAAAASTQGLIYLKNNYKVSFVEGPEPIPLDEDSEEMVYKFKFIWLNTAEGFQELEVSFAENLSGASKYYIRRCSGKTILGNFLQMDLINLVNDQGIPDERFFYEPPATANVYSNFLYEDVN